jgi:hypothetical protein
MPGGFSSRRPGATGARRVKAGRNVDRWLAEQLECLPEAERTMAGVLSRNLCRRPAVTDAFGKAGRKWLAGLELPIDELLTRDGCLRQVDSSSARSRAGVCPMFV